MKLSHAALMTLTAIAELPALIGVGSGALLGHIASILIKTFRWNDALAKPSSLEIHLLERRCLFLARLQLRLEVFNLRCLLIRQPIQFFFLNCKLQILQIYLGVIWFAHKFTWGVDLWPNEKS